MLDKCVIGKISGDQRPPNIFFAFYSPDCTSSYCYSLGVALTRKKGDRYHHTGHTFFYAPLMTFPTSPQKKIDSLGSG